jgi:hypothetical protein
LSALLVSIFDITNKPIIEGSMALTALLPMLVFLGLFLRFVPSKDTDPPTAGALAYAFIVSSITWGVLVTLSTEILSLFDGLSRIPIALFWLLALLFVANRSDIIDRIRTVVTVVKAGLKSYKRFEKLGLLCLVFILAVTLAIALVSPPNNVDSLLYHMARVVHWAQDHDLNHYATAYDHQLFMPIWAETAILHIRVLFGSDSISNLVQWFSFFGCIMAAGSISLIMGFSRKIQLLSAMFVATIPLALLEATSTQNDLVVAFWLSCLGFLILYGQKHGFDWRTTVGIGAVTALGLLTKVTFYVYVVPAWVAILFIWFAHNPRRQVLARIGVCMGIVLCVNAGFWIRNTYTFGNPIGPNEFVSSSTAFTAQAYDVGRQAAENQSADQGESLEGGYFSRLLSREKRMVVWNLAVPLAPLRDRIPPVDSFLQAILDQEQYSDLDGAIWNHEDTAGNPVHFILIGIAMLAVIVLVFRRQVSGEMLVYGIIALAAYLLLPVVIANADNLYSVRFQIPVFVLAGPFVAGVFNSFSTIASTRIQYVMLLSLFAFSLPWLLLNNTRPVIGWVPWVTRVDSVFAAEDEELLFAMNPGARDEFEAVASSIESNRCTRIGLDLDSHDYEYLFWHLLDAPEAGIQIRSITASESSSRYLDTSFSPCAVICTRCAGLRDYLGLKLNEDYGKIQLFMNTD